VNAARGGHKVLRDQQNEKTDQWQPSQLKPGTRLTQPAPLFKKLDEDLVEAERSRLGKIQS
jgi:methionyl-tRNA synthetase